LINSLFPKFSHILCLSEYHLKQLELDQINLDVYKLGAAYCRKSLLKGRVSIFVHEKYNYLNVYLSKFCKEQDIEACALKLQFLALNIYVITVYRAPCCNFISFLNGLDSITKSLHKAELKLIICGDINIDYLKDNEGRKQLDAMLLSYNLAATVHFPTRVQNQSCRAIDNIFVDTYKFRKYTAFPIYNGLSDHDAQLLTLKDINVQTHTHSSYSIRNINKYSVEEFKIRLSYEFWDRIFGNNDNMDVDSSFNIFLNNYLRTVYTSFSL
jgi:exonuclease III